MVKSDVGKKTDCMDFRDCLNPARSFRVWGVTVTVLSSHTALESSRVLWKKMTAAKLAIIWMHGLGDRGASWQDLKSQMKFEVPAKWVFPDAPTAPVTCNNGFKSTSWFDIEDIPVRVGAKDYPEDIKKSVERIHGMIADLEKEGYQSTEIFVGGFSQGGAMSMQAALRYPKRLGGALCISGWLLMSGEAKSFATSAGVTTPIFWGHGTGDKIVDFKHQAVGVKVLEELGCQVSSEAYPGVEHTLSKAGMQHVHEFLSRGAAGELCKA